MKILYLIFSLFLFSGCANKICGINEKAFNNLSKSSKEKICLSYQEQQIKNKQIELEKIKLNKEELKRTQIYNHKIILSIEGTLKKYSKYSPIVHTEISLMENQVKRICLNLENNDPACFWIGYSGNKIYWNLDPDHDFSYLDKHLRRRYFDSQTSISHIYYNSMFPHSVKLKGRYRGYEGFLKYKVRRLK